MEIEIDTKSKMPAYLQIVTQITKAVRMGTLAAGHSLPPVRQLASDLMINPNTVAKAYKLLEVSRVVVGAGRKGTFVADHAKVSIEQNNSFDAKLELGALLSSFKGRGISAEEISTLLFEHINELKGTSS